MKSIFVIGTDTGIGKTVICGLLARYLQTVGKKVITQKWIQTGSKARSGSVRPYVFKFPASPHLSASLEKRFIRPAKIKESFKDLKERSDFVIVEGLGGVLVPYNNKKLVIDIARDLKLPVLIVAGNKLGAINHTLLTIEAVKSRGMKISGVIFNNFSSKGNKLILKDNPKIVELISAQKILGTLPFIKNKNLLYKKFLPIAAKLCLPGLKKT